MDQVTDRAMRPGMEPVVNSTVKMLGDSWYLGLQAKPVSLVSRSRFRFAFLVVKGHRVVCVPCSRKFRGLRKVPLTAIP